MQQNVPQSLAQTSVANDTAQLYQQLLAQMQNQQQSQPPSLPISPPAQNVQNQATTDLILQQLASTLVNPSLASSLQPQLASLAAAQQAATQANAFNATNPNLAALSSLINASPSLLPSLVQANGQPAQNPNNGINPMDSLASQLLMSGGANQGNLLAILNLLQTNPLLASQLVLQQQQQSMNPNLALFAQLMNNSNATAAANRVSDINQLAALLQQAQVPSQGIPSQGEQTPKLYDKYLLQQKQAQESQALAAAVSAVARQLPGRLSTQNSSNSLLGGLTNGFDSPTSTTMPAHPAGYKFAVFDSGRQFHDLNKQCNKSGHSSYAVCKSSSFFRSSIKQQSTSNSITSQTSEIAGSSQQNSPSLFHQVPNNRLPTTRSQSMHESQMSLHCGSLTSGQPIIRNSYPQPTAAGQPVNNLSCNFCGVKFPNDAGLRVHEVRCNNKKETLTSQQINYQLQQQQKLLAQKQHQSNIAALVGGGAGVAPDSLILNGSSSGRSSVPIGSGTTGAGVQASPPIPTNRNAGSPSTSSTGSENRHPLKKRLLESVAKNSSDANNAQSTTSSPTSVTPEGQSLSESRQLITELLNSHLERRQEVLNTENPTATTLLQQLTKQILYAPVVSDKCPKQMREWILYSTSYVKAGISIKMPYILTLDKKISDLYLKHSEFITPALLITRGRARNVTVELNTTHTAVPTNRVLSKGQSLYTSYPKQQDRVLVAANNVSTSATETTQLRAEPKLEPIPETSSDSNAMDTETTPKVEEREKSQEPDKQLTEAVTKRPSKLNFKPMGKERQEELDVYVRGRGRGRYVCEQCGIKCKKPSMLKKHLNVHTDIRLYKCITCNFAFKTKGNLTKHLLNSKTHRIKVANSRSSVEIPKTTDGDQTVITTEADIDNAIQRELKFVDGGFDNRIDEEDNESDNELGTEHDRHQREPIAKFWRFGQENILWQRETHTPPTLWTCMEDEGFAIMENRPSSYWPAASEARSCHSAPPLALCSPTPSKNRRSNLNPLASASSSLGFNLDTSPSNNGESGEASTNNELLTNYIPMLKNGESMPSVNSSNDFDFNSLFNAEELQLECEHCDRKFRKQSDWHFHKQTHLIEQQQNSRSRTYQCPECKVVHRSRAHLEKHIADQHEHVSISDDHSPTTFSNELDNASTSVDTQPPSQQNMRRYWCSDCNIGFRTHGVLAKHLRTKNHVKSLVQQNKLPEDALLLVKDNAGYLLEVDTTNCIQKANQLHNALRSNSCMIGISSSAQRRLIGNEIKSGASTPGLLSAYRLSANGRTFNPFIQQSPNSNTGIVAANVWTPPLVDQLVDEKHHHILDHAESVASSTKEEVMSESTGRSESSTPNTLAFHDGNDLKCPRRGCDRIFPNKVSLRNHITAHFLGGGATVDNSATKQLHRMEFKQFPNHSPGAPESTHTVSTENKLTEPPKTEDQQRASLACSMCSQEFTDAQKLQTHWMIQHLSNNRTHICNKCDAGFTNAESLKAHVETHK
ncbi:Transcription factor HIVEP3 [Aphelenchoides bicaudatus]|nr:Transcription factor HIVEP3 [Aphelenchoides bicaudatus]